MWNKKTGQGTYIMSIFKSASALVAGAVMSLGAVASPSVATAADILPVKAKAPIVGAYVPLDVHGYFDLTFATSRVTPGGLMIYKNGGYLTQADVGLSLDLYKNPTGFINSFTVFGGVWNEFWSDAPPGSQSWQEMDWYAGFTVGFAQYWKFTAQRLDFNFPCGQESATCPHKLENYYFILGYDDAHWGLLFPLNPTVKMLWTRHGGSAVVLGKTEDGYRFEVGIAPTFDMKKYWGVPVTLGVPTWFSVAPEEYFNAGTPATALCGALQNLPCGLSSLGVFSTGLQARYSLAGVVPTRLGNWYLKGGVQYYHILNDALLASQVITGAASSFNDAHKDIFVGTTGLGFSF
jgi:hypothetical protein